MGVGWYRYIYIYEGVCLDLKAPDDVLPSLGKARLWPWILVASGVLELQKLEVKVAGSLLFTFCQTLRVQVPK